MSPLDIAVLVFFMLIAVKAFSDSLEFWREQDAEAAAVCKKVTVPSKPAVSTVRRKTEVVTRTPVRVPYRVYRVDSIRSASVPAPYKRKLPSSRGAGRQMETAA